MTAAEAARVESLSHEELRNHRIHFECPGHVKKSPKSQHEPKDRKQTITKHKEWFKVERKVALETVGRWHTFIQCKPYRSGPGDFALTDAWVRWVSDLRDRSKQQTIRSKTLSGQLKHGRSEYKEWFRMKSFARAKNDTALRTLSYYV